MVYLYVPEKKTQVLGCHGIITKIMLLHEILTSLDEARTHVLVPLGILCTVFAAICVGMCKYVPFFNVR